MKRNICALFLLLSTLLSASTASFAEDIGVACIGPQPPVEFKQALEEAGYSLTDAVTDADVICVVTPFGRDDAARQVVAAAIGEALAKGKTLIACGGDRAEQLKALTDLLPVNPWSIQAHSERGSLSRGDSGCLIKKSSSLADQVDFTGFRVSNHYDVHLPYSSIEAGEHKYQWEKYGKDLLNTDWQTHLYSNEESRMPLLVSGRTGPGTVFVFGASLYDGALVNWQGYKAFVAALMQPSTAPAAENTLKNPPVKIAIPQYQPDVLYAKITNAGQQPVSVLVAYKIRNAERAMLNSATKAVTIPAQSGVTVRFDHRSPELGDPAIAASADKLPYRFIDVGVASPDRTTLFAKASAFVSICPQLTLEIHSPDIRSYDDLTVGSEDQLPMGEHTGVHVDRYVYTIGSWPELTISLKNALQNIAPLARTVDMQWPDNPSLQGINDLCYKGQGNTRGKFPSYGMWGGRTAPEQRLVFLWDSPVHVAGLGLAGFTDYRRWNLANAHSYTLTAATLAGEAKLAQAHEVEYNQARHEQVFAPATVNACTLTLSDLDQKDLYEPRPLKDVNDVNFNCGMAEFELYGWPAKNLPPRATGELVVSSTDLQSGQKTELLREQVSARALDEVARKVVVPTKNAFGPVRIDAIFTPDNGQPVKANFDVLFVEPDRNFIKSKNELAEVQRGQFCTAGFIAVDQFGIGTQDGTQGWGGNEDQTWAVTHETMEIGSRSIDTAERMFTTPARPCHYINPWGNFPSGQYVWDWIGDNLVQEIKNGKYKGIKSLRLFLSDRWNGIPVGSCFNWNFFIEFDQYLRKTTGHGLEGRSRKQICQEITSEYGDVWQKWAMNRYADKLVELQDRLATLGVDFSVTTHGSFPLAGGELGAKIGKTHKATGIDVFWELFQEDLYHTLGYRFGLIAANPDLEPGAYCQWGWVSGVLFNSTWFAVPGTNEPSRRQWYSSYFLGRVTSEGTYAPLSVWGFDSQGAYGPKMTRNTHQEYLRTAHFTVRVRPEKPCGVGLVVSWPAHERRMSKQAGRLGCGVYAADGQEQIDRIAGYAYEKLIKCGVPVAFVTSTHSLKNWNGSNPLVVVDGGNLEDWEYAELDRLNRQGVPIFAFGANEADSQQKTELFGVQYADGSYHAADAEAVSLGNAPLAFSTTRDGRGPTLFCSIYPGQWSNLQADVLAEKLLDQLGQPIITSDGVAVTPFISNDRLFVTLGDQGLQNRTISVKIKPALLKQDYTGESFRVIDLDNADVVPSKWEGGALRFSIPTAASDGRIVMIVKD